MKEDKDFTEEEIESGHQELWEAYLKLSEEFRDKLPIYEFGYGIIRNASRMLYDVSETCKLATETIEAGREDGLSWSYDRVKAKLHPPKEENSKGDEK